MFAVYAFIFYFTNLILLRILLVLKNMNCEIVFRKVHAINLWNYYQFRSAMDLFIMINFVIKLSIVARRLAFDPLREFCF